MTQEKRFYKIAAAFSGFLLLFIANLFVPVSGAINHTARMWLILDCCVIVISAGLLLRAGLPSKARLNLSLVYALLMFVAYRGVSFSSVKGFVSVFLCSLAAFRIFELAPDQAIPPIRAARFQSVLASLLLGLGVGGALGTVNLFLSGQPLRFHLTVDCFLTALSPAILEEICYRLLLYAFCLSLLGGEIRNRSEQFWCYFMMVVPHILLHTPDVFLQYGVISGLINSAIMTLLFGLPFALLQRKRDLTTAMVAHGVVDLIRFAFLGLPF